MEILIFPMGGYMTVMDSDRQLFIFATNQLNLEAEELQRDLDLPKDRAMILAQQMNPRYAKRLQN
jgi:hypothetical protein